MLPATLIGVPTLSAEINRPDPGVESSSRKNPWIFPKL